MIEPLSEPEKKRVQLLIQYWQEKEKFYSRTAALHSHPEFVDIIKQTIKQLEKLLM